jgi:threonine synthase
MPLIAAQNLPNAAQLRYFVIIPTGLVSELQRVQAIAPNAQLRSSYRGTYIEVQGYPDRPSADILSSTIRRQGFDSRVAFF